MFIYNESTNTSIMQKTREGIILEILGKKNNLTFAELIKASKTDMGKKMGTESCVLGLKELKIKKLIKKDEKTKRYSLITNTDNKILLSTRKHNLLNFNLDEMMEELKEHETPFVMGYSLLRGAMYDLPKFTLERHSVKLAEHEKRELDKVIKCCNDTIERTFNVLEKLDENQTTAIKIGIDNAMTIPYYEEQLEKLATNRQKRRAKKISIKIIKTI